MDTQMDRFMETGTGAGEAVLFEILSRAPDMEKEDFEGTAAYNFITAAPYPLDLFEAHEFARLVWKSDVDAIQEYVDRGEWNPDYLHPDPTPIILWPAYELPWVPAEDEDSSGVLERWTKYTVLEMASGSSKMGAWKMVQWLLENRHLAKEYCEHMYMEWRLTWEEGSEGARALDLAAQQGNRKSVEILKWWEKKSKKMAMKAKREKKRAGRGKRAGRTKR